MGKDTALSHQFSVYLWQFKAWLHLCSTSISIYPEDGGSQFLDETKKTAWVSHIDSYFITAQNTARPDMRAARAWDDVASTEEFYLATIMQWAWRGTYWVHFNWILQPTVFLVAEVVVIVGCDRRVLNAVPNLSKSNFSAWNNKTISAEGSTSVWYQDVSQYWVIC